MRPTTSTPSGLERAPLVTGTTAAERGRSAAAKRVEVCTSPPAATTLGSRVLTVRPSAQQPPPSAVRLTSRWLQGAPGSSPTAARSDARPGASSA